MMTLDRSRLLLIVIFLTTGAVRAQPAWVWAKGAGSNQNWESGSSVATDSAGNVYVTGFAQGSSFSLPGSGFEDIIVAKYQANGTLSWVAKSGGSGADIGRGIAVDGSGSVYVTGVFDGAATFRSAAPSTVIQQLTSNGGQDVFLAKYDANGLLQWVTKAGSQYNVKDEGTAIAVDQVGGVYITGYFDAPEVDFFHQPGTAFAQQLYLSGFQNPAIFVAKYKNDGTFVWAKGVAGYGANRGNGVAVNSAGTTVVVTGAFQQSVDFGNSVTLMGAGAWSDVFVVAYDGVGLALWAQQVTGPDTAAGNAVVLDPQGAVYVAGEFSGPTTFYGDPATPSNTVSSGLNLSSQVSSGGSNTFDVFIAKYNASGIRQWVQQAGGKAHDYAYGLTLAGSVLLTTGFFDLSATFGTQQLTSAGNFDVFVAAYDSSGASLWAVKAGGPINDGGRGVAAFPGAVYVTGSFQSSPASFGSHILNSIAGSEDIFTAKLNFVAGPDLYIQDATNDVGDEPDIQAGSVLWASPDIWVRNSKAVQTASNPPRFNNEHNHENPEYAQVLANTPWIYVKTRNRGSSAVSGTLHVYWARASLGLDWPGQWTEITPVGTSTITNLAPGGIWVVELQWTDIPLPNDPQGEHFCLLARFEADASTPDPIVGEVANNGIWGNVYNSNNIGWKNVTVMNLVQNKRGETVHSQAFVHNINRHPSLVRLSLGSPDLPAARSFFCRGMIELDLGPVLYQRWLRGGMAGKGVRIVRGNVVRITSPQAWLGNILLEADEQHLVKVTFKLVSRLPARHRHSFTFDLIQLETINMEGRFERSSVIGGVRYEVEIGRRATDVSILRRLHDI